MKVAPKQQKKQMANVVQPKVPKGQSLLNTNEQKLFRNNIDYIKNVTELAICKCFFSVCEGTTMKGPALASLMMDNFDGALTSVLKALREGEQKMDKPLAGLTNVIFTVATSSAIFAMNGPMMLRKYRLTKSLLLMFSTIFVFV